jgi:hypothetical protein
MSDSFPVDSQPENMGGAPRILLVTAVSLAAAALAVFLWFGSGRRQSSPSAIHLPFGAVEQSYAPEIHVESVRLSRAENYLHQEVTIVKGDLVNSGERSLQRVELTIEFLDEMHQVVLRHSVISAAAQPLPPKGSREFEVSLEHISSSWNMREPVIRIAGLEFSPTR